MEVYDNAEMTRRRKVRPFCDHIMEFFQYLVDDYGFQVVMFEEQQSAGFVVYRNSEFGGLLKIAFKTTDGYCSLGIGRLKDGKPEKLLTAIDPKGNHIDWEFLDVNDSLPVKNDEDKPPRTLHDGTKTGRYMGQNAMWEYMADHANLLHEYGGSFLQGKMKLLPAARKNLVKRLRSKGWKVPGFFQTFMARFRKSS